MTYETAADICARVMSSRLATRAWVAALVLRAHHLDREWRWYAAWNLLRGRNEKRVIYDAKQYG